jgi:hypothetical protein
MKLLIPLSIAVLVYAIGIKLIVNYVYDMEQEIKGSIYYDTER